MNQLKCTLLGLLCLLYFSTNAQPKKGSLLLGLSSNIGESSIAGFSYERNKVKSTISSFRDSVNYRRVSYNFGIKAAHFFNSNFALGADLYYGSSISASGNELYNSNRFIYSAGLFMRYYVPYKNGLLLYFEGATSFGLEYKDYYTEGIFNSTTYIVEYVDFSSSSLAAGVSVPLIEKVFLDFALAGNYLYRWDSGASQFQKYNVTQGFNLKLGFSVFF